MGRVARPARFQSGVPAVKLLYITTNFHSLTLTFVTREVNGIRALGEEVHLLSLRRKAPYATAEPACDLSGCRYLYPVPPLRALGGVVRMLATRPRRFLGAVGLALRSRLDSPGIKLKLLYQLAASTTAVAAVESLGVQRIHAHLASPPGNVAMFLSRLTGIPFSFTGHAADLYREPECLDVKLRAARGVVCISEYNLAHYRTLAPELRDARVVHCGVDVDEFAFRPRDAVHAPLRLLAVGRAAEKKGFRHLLDALALLTERGIPWRCHVVGGGPLLEDLQRQREALGLHELELMGAQQQSVVKELLAQADAFVLPCVVARDGDIDGIPVSLMEAMAVGCPVVSTRVSGIPELVIHGETGLLADPEDPAGLADAFARLAGEPDLAARLSRAGREHVAREFNLATETAKLRDYFRELDGA